MNYNYLAIEGNIGSGKTSLSTMLAEEFNGKLVLEEFADNPFLPSFYKNPDKYAFQLELSFLAERFQQLQKELNKDLFHQMVVSDYLIQKCLIFAQSNLDPDTFKLYRKLYQIISLNFPNPDLLLYLYAGVDRLQQNIRKRGRSYEQDISNDYLEKIQASYFSFFKQQKGLKIVILNTENLDFVNNREHYNMILDILKRPFDKGITRITL